MYRKGCGWPLFADAEGTNERGNERSLIYLMRRLRARVAPSVKSVASMIVALSSGSFSGLVSFNAATVIQKE